MPYEHRFGGETTDRQRHRNRELGSDRSPFFDDGRESRSDRESGPRAHRGSPEQSRNSDRRWHESSRRDEQRFGSDDNNRGIPMDETARLIASNKVEGTAVYDRFGDKIGTVHNFMVDKYSGEVKYAVLRHSGGFLGLGERYYPLEWCDLTYDTDKDGYRVDFAEDDLRDMRSFGRDDEWRRRPRGEHRGDGRSSSGRDDDHRRGDRGGRW